MQISMPRLREASLERLSTEDQAALLGSARVLQGTDDGRKLAMLKGCNLGLLSRADCAEEAARFCRAAAALGAHVARLHPHAGTAHVAETARMLAQLYDGIEFLECDAEIAQTLEKTADVRVYRGIASPRHPTAALAERLDETRPLEDRRRAVIQAVLLSTL